MTGPIKFSPGNHQYRLDGKPVKGVTTLISGGLPKPALVRWSANTVAEYVADHPEEIDQLRGMGRNSMVNALKGVPWDSRDKAAARGTEVHKLGESVVHGIEVEVPGHIVGHVEGYARFLDAWNVEPILVEQQVANRQHWYAGTFDLVATIKGVIWMLDLKTAKGVYGENALQLAAYRNAEFWQDDGGQEQPLPDIERCGVLHVREDGTDLVPLDSSEAPFRDFLHCAWICKRADAIKGYVMEPLHVEDVA